jgi:parvulin-like peptidyl-prolyl isomerase
MKRESFAFQLATLLAGAMILSVNGPTAAATEDDAILARVDDIVITRQEFEREVYTAARQTFYHGRPPTGDEFIEFRKSVADDMIDRRLLLREAKRRKLEPDHGRIDERIASYEARYGDTERWQSEGPEMVAALRVRFEEDSLIDVLEADVRSVARPDSAAVREYYDANPDLFTEPARNRVSLILVGVPPSASPAMWQEAREEAARIGQRLDENEPFDGLARAHSSDRTAEAGGDMGYLHEGTLSPSAELAIAELAIGEVSEPVQVLEGMAIFKLTEQQPSRLRSFDDVKGRAEELWLRDKGEEEWNLLVAELRSASDVDVDTDYLASLPGSQE